MKTLFFALFALFATPLLAVEKSMVHADDLRDLLRECRNSFNEARCLRTGILDLIDRDRYLLECRQGRNGQYAVYDVDNLRFLDHYYRKTLSECRESIEAVNYGLFCSVGNNGRFAVQKVRDAQFISPNYSISFEECLGSLQGIRNDRVCIAGSNARYARYDLIRETFIDARYEMNLETCNQRL